jgi:hypothetical protein
MVEKSEKPQSGSCTPDNALEGIQITFQIDWWWPKELMEII